jgi:cytochrome c oxidase subunit 3
MSSMTTVHPMNKTSTGRIALLITLGAESVFFITLLVAYASLRDEVIWNVSHTLTRLTISLINTAILLLSAITAWLSTRAIRRNEQASLRSGLLITLSLGLIFVAGQIYEFGHAGLHMDDPSFGGVFFTLISFHAVHVLAGVVFLALNYVRATWGDFSSTRYETIELGNWFWFYVAGVWLVLFVVLYLV